MCVCVCVCVCVGERNLQFYTQCVVFSLLQACIQYCHKCVCMSPDPGLSLQVGGYPVPLLWRVCCVPRTSVLPPLSLQSGRERAGSGRASLGGCSSHHQPLSGQTCVTVCICIILYAYLLLYITLACMLVLLTNVCLHICQLSYFFEPVD